MGSGKKNYKSMRAKCRQWQKPVKIEEEKKVIKQEDIDELKKIWVKKKKEDENNT